MALHMVGFYAAIGTFAALLFTKLADCISTLQRISAAGQETNPRARNLMERWGIRTTVWAFGALAAATALLCLLPVYRDTSGWSGLTYFLVGLPIAAVQADVARSNWTGRLGPLARWVKWAHQRRWWWQ